jgi:hypothetical protein
MHPIRRQRQHRHRRSDGRVGRRGDQRRSACRSWVGLGSPGGSTLGYSDATESQGTAEATKEVNGYKITGTAVGLDPSNSQALTKSFELDVACP